MQLHQELEYALSKLMELIELMEQKNFNNQELQQLTEATYEDIVSKYRPIIDIIGVISQKLGKDCGPIVGLIGNFIIQIIKNPQVEQMIQKINQFKAKQLFNLFVAYQAAGFEREEAMKLLLQDIKNPFKIDLDLKK